MATETGLALFAGVVVAHALGVASPGPDFAVVMRQALAHGRAAGVQTAAGIGSGIVFHLAYGLFGLQWLMQQLPMAIHVIALAGAAFLIWMGAGALRAQPLPEQDAANAEVARGGRADFLLGLATNVLNPKATLFFAAAARPATGDRDLAATGDLRLVCGAGAAAVARRPAPRSAPAGAAHRPRDGRDPDRPRRAGDRPRTALSTARFSRSFPASPAAPASAGAARR